MFLSVIFLNGIIFLNQISKKILITNFFEISFIGLILSLCIAKILNIFIPLNDILLYLNILFVVIYLFIKKINFKKIKIDKLIFLTVLLISLINIFGSNFSDDLDHYHYSYILNTDKTNYIWGLNYLHPLYGTSSIWLIGQSYFNFDFSRLQDIHILNGLILFLFLGIFLSQLRIKNKLTNIFQPIFFSILIFVLLKYTRLKEFGIDRPAYLILFISFYYYLKYLNNYKSNEINNHFLIFSIIILSIFFIKVIFIFLLLFPLLYFYRNYKKIDILNKKYMLLFIFLFSYFINNILISGCLIYPLTISCIEYLPWTNLDIINQFKNSNEIFNKSFPSYEGLLISNEYIKNFNWISTWFVRHKIELLEFIITIILVIILTFVSFKYKKKLESNSFDLYFFNKALLIILFFSILIFIFKNPNIRMNHHIFIILMILSISYLINSGRFVINQKVFISIIFISLIFNFSKNLKRIHETNYENNPLKTISSKISEQQKYNIDDFVYFKGWYGKAPASNNKIEDKKFKKIFLFKIIY